MVPHCLNQPLISGVIPLKSSSKPRDVLVADPDVM